MKKEDVDSDKPNDNEKIHSDAFDEAAANLAKPDSGKPNDEGKPTNEAGKEGDGESKTIATNDGAQVDNAGGGGEEEKGKGDGAGNSVEPDFKAELEKERQKTKSWQGRISRAERIARERDEENQRLREENERLKAGSKPSTEGADTGKPKGEDDPLAVLSDDERAAFEEVRDQYPTIAKALDAARKLAAKEAQPANVTERVEKIEKRIANDDKAGREAHIQTLEREYPEFYESENAFEEFRGALDEWIETLPYKDAVRYQRIRDKGDTETVLDMLDEFAKSTGRKVRDTGTGKPNNTPPNDKNRRLESMTAVPRHSGKPAAGGGAPAKDDYDGAFDRAAASHQR